MFYSSEQKKCINFRSVNGAHKLVDAGESSCTEHGCPDFLSYNSVAADVDENGISAITTEFHLDSDTFLFITDGRGQD